MKLPKQRPNLKSEFKFLKIKKNIQEHFNFLKQDIELFQTRILITKFLSKTYIKNKSTMTDILR